VIPLVAKLNKLKAEICKENFTFGNGQAQFNTTNKELMRSSSMPNLGEGPPIKNSSKIKKMMRNHHFIFGNNKADFSSTFNDNFIPHKIKNEGRYNAILD